MLADYILTFQWQKMNASDAFTSDVCGCSSESLEPSLFVCTRSLHAHMFFVSGSAQTLGNTYVNWRSTLLLAESSIPLTFLAYLGKREILMTLYYISVGLITCVIFQKLNSLAYFQIPEPSGLLGEALLRCFQVVNYLYFIVYLIYFPVTNLKKGFYLDTLQFEPVNIAWQMLSAHRSVLFS